MGRVLRVPATGGDRPFHCLSEGSGPQGTLILGCNQREGRASPVLNAPGLGIASESLGQELDADRAAKTGVFGELDPVGRVPTTSL